MQTTRRGFLKGSLIGAAATGCVQGKHETALGQHPELDAAATASAASSSVSLRTTVNGEPRTLEVGPDESALDLVRERLGLTGCKKACGHGACGACTMQLDGTPVVTCLLPATSLEGRRLTTIEGIAGIAGTAATLHPVQRAFMAEDALQCGFCTPGFVVEATAFVDRHRALHGDVAPAREEIAAALSGHLCRCGAQAAIYRAVAGACEGKFDAGPDHGPRIDALAKVTGAARYTVDVAPEGVLVGKCLRSPHAHARIRKIDWSNALALPGIHGGIELTRPGHKVRFAGQEIVALAGVDADTVEAALAHVHVEYELLDAVVGYEAALADGAPELYERGKTRRRAPNSNEMPPLPETWSGNLRGPFELLSHHKGRARRRIETLAAGKAGNDAGPGHLVSLEFETTCQAHTALEPRAVVAQWEAGRLTVHLSTQAVRQAAIDIAEHWGLRRDDVTVIAEHIGGGFGAKAVLPFEVIVAVELAKVCARPVKVVNDRREELTVGGSRPKVRARIDLGDDGGEQPAVIATMHADAGVAVGSAATAMLRIHLPQADLALADYDVINNAPPGCPFRGPGGPPAYFAIEQAVDQLALNMGVDPIALRQRWNRNDSRARVLEWAAALPLWRDRPPPRSDEGRYRRGVGLASASWMHLTDKGARVQLDAGPDGIVIQTATQDIGSGTRTLLADVVAGQLGVDPQTLRVEIGTSKGVHGPTAGGSRSASALAPAAVDAATQLIEELVDQARTRLRLIDAKPIPGGVAHRDGQLTWAEILELGPTISVTGKRGVDQGGFILPPIADVSIGRYLSAAVQVSEVEVDTRLGRVRVLRSVLGASVGHVYSPVLARSQVEGAITQGISYALYEDRRLDPRHGRLLTGNLEDYRLIGIGDVGEIEVSFVPGGFERVRGQGVGLGELATLPVAATIANAVHHATGWRPTQLPLRPDRVLERVRA